MSALMGTLADAASVMTAEPVVTWDCTGRYSSLTYQDCQGQYYDTSGCYFLEHFAQYRPCAQICNDDVVHSIDEEKCRAYCSGDLLFQLFKLFR